MNMHSRPVQAIRQQFEILTRSILYPRIYEPAPIVGHDDGHEYFGLAVRATEFFATAPYGESAYASKVHLHAGMGENIINLRGDYRPMVTEAKGRYDIMKEKFDRAMVRNRSKDSLFFHVPAKIICRASYFTDDEGSRADAMVLEVIIDVKDITKC